MNIIKGSFSKEPFKGKNMKKIATMDEYIQLLKDIKKKYSPIFTNCYMFKSEISRLITQNRFYYEEIEGGGIFYADELTHYQAYYHVNIDCKIHFNKKEKDIVIKNIYLDGRKPEKIKRIEQKIAQTGFELVDRMGQIEGDPKVILQNIERPFRISERILKQEGFQLTPAKKEMLNEIRDMQLQINEIPYYQFSYYSDEELIDEADQGHLVCILNPNDEICAVRHFFIEGSGIYGWIAIKEPYKKKYGMAIVFSEYTLRYAMEHDLKVLGWITDTNSVSIQYHHKIGYHWTGRYADEWLLRTK